MAGPDVTSTEFGPLTETAISAEGSGLLILKLAIAVPQLAVASVLANSLAAQKLPSEASTLMPLRSPARWPKSVYFARPVPAGTSTGVSIVPAASEVVRAVTHIDMKSLELS